MKLFTKAQYEQLIKNGTEQDGFKDFQPVVKWFTPDANCTWLISEIDPVCPDIAFGLCDLGIGCPEMGSVSIEEVEEIRGQLNLPVERDRSFKAVATLLSYWSASLTHNQIVDSPNIILEQVTKEESQQEEQDLQHKVKEFVEREIVQNVSSLIEHHKKTDEQFRGEFTHLLFHFDEDDDVEEIYEYWTVSNWLADKLIAQGEAVEKDFYGLCVWGRTTTGQAIAMDYVMREIYQSL